MPDLKEQPVVKQKLFLDAFEFYSIASITSSTNQWEVEILTATSYKFLDEVIVDINIEVWIISCCVFFFRLSSTCF